MSSITIRAFSHENGSFIDHGVAQGILEVDTTSETFAKLREQNKKATVLIVPVLEDGHTIDINAIEKFITPARRQGKEWTQEMVADAHQLSLDGQNATGIMLRLYKKYDVEVSEESVKKTLRQEINTEFEIKEELRKKVSVTVPKKGKGRKKYDDKTKAAVVKYMEDGHSGVQAGIKFNIPNSLCNDWYRAKHGYRRK